MFRPWDKPYPSALKKGATKLQRPSEEMEVEVAEPRS